MNKPFFILIITVLISNCKQENVSPQIEKKIYFTGLTKTDIAGDIITNDATDWKANDTWVKQESDLFTSSYQTTCNPSHNYKIIAFPNPGNGIFFLFIDKTPSTRVALRLVDENFKVLISNDSITQTNIAFDAQRFGIKDTVRLYYMFIENNCEFKGHGDILIQ